jgi:hypothetical protein
MSNSKESIDVSSWMERCRKKKIKKKKKKKRILVFIEEEGFMCCMSGGVTGCQSELHQG